MILSYAKPFNEKMRKQLVKIWKKKEKTRQRFFNAFNQWYEKEKTQIYFTGVNILNNSQNATIFTQQA